MLEEKMIAYLKKQKETEYKFEDVNKLELTYLLIEHIGELDGDIRDGLVYPCLAHLLHDNHLQEVDLNNILRLLMGEKFLRFDLENYIDYSVLTRSFSILQLVILVHVHNRDHVIDGKLIKELFKEFLRYFNEEVDLRGFEQNIGFLHSMAHSADLFGQLMKVESFYENELKTIFNAITDKYKTKTFFYMYDEDERFINAIMNGLERDILSREFVLGWIDDFCNYKKIKEFPEAYFLTNNIKVFLRSLYFRTLDHEKHGYIAEKIKVSLKEKVSLH